MDDDWQQHAACKQVDDPDIFFDGAKVNTALAVCHTCPVWQDCLMKNLREEQGVWGCSSRCRRRARKLRSNGGTRSQILALARSSNELALGDVAAELVPQEKLVQVRRRARSC